MISVTCSSLQILDKTKIGAFPISGFLVSLLWRQIVFIERLLLKNSRTSSDTDMMIEPVTNLTRETQQCWKYLTMTPCQQIVTPLSFFQFMDNFKQATTSQIPNAWTVKLTFWLIISFYLKITESRTKKSLI